MSQLSIERLKELLAYDEITGLFSWVSKPNRNTKIGSIAGTLSRGYIQIRIDKQAYLAHRLAWMYVYGKFPADFIDHIDGDKSNNRLSNLRTASMSQNRQNISKPTRTSKTGAKGVCPHRSKYRSSITIDNKYIFLGDYNTILEAAAAYNAAQELYHPYRPVQTAGY